MIETIEKIPALAKLNNMIDEINDVLQQKEGQEYSDTPVKFWIAGGAITSAITGEKINDYDLFSPTPALLYERMKEGSEFSTYENEFFANFRIAHKKVQVILRYSPKNQDELFHTFDFTIVCGAYDGLTFACHDRFWQDIACRRLVVNKLTFPLKTLERIEKYAKRGYSCCPSGLLEISKEINSLTIDWENPDENSLSYYPDGTIRFTGPD